MTRATLISPTTRRRQEQAEIDAAYAAADAEPQVSDAEALRVMAQINAEIETPLTRRDAYDALVAANDTELLFRYNAAGKHYEARSSTQSGTWYTIRFLLDAYTLVVRCACPAGEHGRLCRHSKALKLHIEADRTHLHGFEIRDLVPAKGHPLAHILSDDEVA